VRRREGERFPALPPGSRDLRGARLIGAELSGIDLSGADLSGADLSRANLAGSRLIGANLSGAVLHGACLDDAELMAADLSGADLSDVSAERAGLGKIKARGAQLFSAKLQGASLTGADLREADLRHARLDGARLAAADLSDAVLQSSSLKGADLSEARVCRASFRGADLQDSRLQGLECYRDACWVGADIRSVDFCGAMLLRRHILDSNFLAEFRSQSTTHEWLYRLWWVSSDCGRSISRWAAWTLLVAVVYGGLFSFVELDAGPNPTWLTPLYYSVVTFTTLGYGDVLPASAAAQALAISEVILGYISLGGVLSIMSNKLARRAD